MDIHPSIPFIGVLLSILVLLAGRMYISKRPHSRRGSLGYFFFVGLAALFITRFAKTLLGSLHLSLTGYVGICAVSIALAGYCMGLVAYENSREPVGIIYPLFWALFAPNLALSAALLI